MVYGNLKIFFRSFKKHPGYAISNLSGLAVGMATFVLIFLFVTYEFNWNTYNEKYNRIYRIQQKVLFQNSTDIYTQTGFPLAGELESKIPEIQKAITVHTIWGEYLSSTEELSFYEKKGYYAGPDIFDVFTYHFAEGDPKEALSEPFSIVLTKELAQKYFPGEDAFGKLIKTSQNKALKVTGIIEDLPPNLDLRPNYIVSISTYKFITDWKDFDKLKNISAGISQTYVLLKPGTDVKAVNKKIYNFVDNYVPDNIKKLYLKPLSEVHLTSNERNDIEIALLYIGLIAVFVLLLACINFINLSTANSHLRTKEIGIRKTIGASKFVLFKQFINEAVMYSLLSMIGAFILVQLFLPAFNTIVERQLTFSLAGNLKFIILMITVFIVTGVLAGIYPALYLSSFRPVDVLRGNMTLFSKKSRSTSKSFIRRALVTFQFVVSISMIIVTTFIINQVNFMKNMDLGFIKDNLLLCRVYGEVSNGNFETLRNDLLHNQNIEDASISITAPFNGLWTKEITKEGSLPDEKTNIEYNAAGYNFLNTYKIKLESGRNFSREFPTDSGACLINETAVKDFGWQDPIGKKIDDNRYTIIGVMKDFHPYSVHEKIHPYYLTLNNGKLSQNNIYSIRVRPSDQDNTIRFIKEQFRNYFPDAIIEVAAFDNNFDAGTKGVWEIVEKIFFFFSIIAVLIAANGLFGLVSFAMQRRTKEIGIRKVFGAEAAGLYLLTSREFLALLLIAVLFALPSGYIVSKTTPGAYKYSMQVTDYFIGIGLMFITALLAMMYHTTKAVFSNPVESLRSE